MPNEDKTKVPLKWTESITIEESGEEGKSKWVKIGGVAVEAVTSRNDRKYLAEELAKQDIKGIKIFMDHNSGEARNAVGKIESQGFDGTKLRHESKIRNTVKNPDVVEMVQDGLIDSVSIGATGDLKRIVEDGNEIYEVRNLEIGELSLVGIGGVPSAKIDFATAVAENFSLDNPKPEVEEEQHKKFLILKR